MSYHPLTSGSDYGVVVHDGTLTENTTNNVDLTTLSDDSTASDIPSEICCVHMLLRTDDGGAYETNDNTQTIDDPAAIQGGPNVWGQEADVDYFTAAITKSDGSIDICIPNLAGDPTVKITVLGYSDVDWHNEEQINSDLTFNCSTRDQEEDYVDQVITDAAAASIGAGWHKGAVYTEPGYAYNCVEGSQTCNYDLGYNAYAFSDLAAYTPGSPDDINSANTINRGAGYARLQVGGDIISFSTNADGEVSFSWQAEISSDCTFVDE